MTKRFECTICNKEFLSAYEMAQHFRSAEHKRVGEGDYLDSIIGDFISGVKTSIANQNEKNK